MTNLGLGIKLKISLLHQNKIPNGPRFKRETIKDLEKNLYEFIYSSTVEKGLSVQDPKAMKKKIGNSD